MRLIMPSKSGANINPKSTGMSGASRISPEFPNQKRQQRQRDVEDVKLNAALLQPAQTRQSAADLCEHGPVYFLAEHVGRLSFGRSVRGKRAPRRGYRLSWTG